MFEIYTEKARRTIFFARAEAGMARSQTINSEHLLLALFHADPALLSTLLTSQASEDSLRSRLASRMPEKPPFPLNKDLLLHDDCKRILAFAAEEAKRLDHPHIGNKHLLLGILQEQGCLAERILTEWGADANAIRRTLPTGGHRTEPEPPVLIRGAFARYLDEAREKLASLGYPGAVPGRFSRSGMVFQRFTESARRVIFFARYEASQLGSREIEPEHILLGIARELSKRYTDFLPCEAVSESIRSELPSSPNTRIDPPLSARTKKIFASALEEEDRPQPLAIMPEHLLLAILHEQSSVASTVLQKHKVHPDKIRRVIENLRKTSPHPNSP